jgi:hypothetical protein
MRNARFLGFNLQHAVLLKKFGIIFVFLRALEGILTIFYNLKEDIDSINSLNETLPMR